MKRKPMYNAQGWVLAICMTPNCHRSNYVEPHGTTAYCPSCSRKLGNWVEHENIPVENRSMNGLIANVAR